MIKQSSAVAILVRKAGPDCEIVSINIHDYKTGELDPLCMAEGLLKILSYKMANPQARVIVNMSFGNRFSKYLSKLTQDAER